MNMKFKSLVAAAAFIAAGAASAAVVTVAPGAAYKNTLFTGTQLLTFSPTALSVVNLFPMDVINVAPATVTLTKVTTPRVRVTAISSSTPVSTLAIEDTTDALVSVSGLGGFTLSAVGDGMVSEGGAASITDLSVDLVNKVIRGKLSSTNPTTGAQVFDNIVLWSFDTVTGVTQALPLATSGSANSFTLSGLHLSTQARQAIEQGLQATELGVSAIDALNDFGTLQVDLQGRVAQLTTCTVDFATKAARTGQLSNTVTVRNLTTSPATGWAVQWQYANTVLLTNVKNATLTRSDTKTYTAKPVKANTTLTANGSTAFTFTTLYAGTAPATKVLSATVAGQTCGVSQP